MSATSRIISVVILIHLLCAPVYAQEYPISWEPDPWPEIRKERIQKLLPQAMMAANVDAWITICRENNNDPLADHIGGENASGTAVFLFYFAADGFHSKVFSPIGESTALDELDIHDEVIPIGRVESAIRVAGKFIQQQNFKRIAINTSYQNELADGLSHSQYQNLTKALGPSAERLVSSDELVYEWLSVKLPAEIKIMQLAAELTAEWQVMAYQSIIPGTTTDADVAKFIKERMALYGVGDAWAPDQNPNVNSGADRGHSHATDKVIMPGDVIQTDFGIRLYDRWVSDIQRFAYVMHENETEAPAAMQAYWENAKAGNRAAYQAMKPGVKGIDVDRAQRELMKKRNSEYVMWSTGHPVGYVAHDVGPNLGGSQSSHVRPAAEKQLEVGMTFAFDGFYSWKRQDGSFKTISVEEMVVINEEGAEYLIAPQEALVLIPSLKE